MMQAETLSLSSKTETRTFSIRRLSRADIPAALSLQEEVLSLIPSRALFEPLTEAELLESAEIDSVFGFFDGDTLAAFSMIIHNRETDRSLAPDAEKACGETFTFDGVLVHPAYRGFGMQRLFLSLTEKEAKKCGASCILATTAPPNLHSRKNFESMGFSIVKEYIKYGYPRLLLKKEL